MLTLMSVCADLVFHRKHKQLLMCILSFSQPIWSSQVPQVLGRRGLFSSSFNSWHLGESGVVLKEGKQPIPSPVQTSVWDGLVIGSVEHGNNLRKS